MKRTTQKPASRAAAPPPLETFHNLKQAVRAADRCGALELSGKKLESLPNELGKLQRMTRLNLADNWLVSVPASLFTLTGLETLLLRGNGLPRLSEKLGRLAALKTLDLSRTQLAELPESIGALGSLEVLSLEEAKLTRVPDSILKLSRLRVLSLGGLSQLAAPLPNLGALTELEHLDLRRLRRPEGVIDAIDFSSLTRLVELDLSTVKTSTFPPSVRDLPRLTTLAVEQAAFTELPESFATLSGLIELKAWSSAFTSWPSALNELPRLKTIDFRQSKLASLEGLRSMPALEWLSLESTPLAELPAKAPELPALRCLSLQGTRVTRLPAWLASLPALETLLVGNTPLAAGELDALRRRRPALELRA